jgi:hypothetical protein
VSNASDNINAAAPSLQATLQPSTVKLGDILLLNVQTAHPPGLPVDMPSFQKELGTFEVVASTALPPQLRGDRETQQFQVQLQNFTTGQQILPGIAFSYKSADGKHHVLKTPELKVAVELVPPGPKDKGGDIRGIKGVLGPVAISPWWWLLLVFALIVAGAAFWSQRRKTIQGPLPAPPIPPDLTALEKLQELAASGWLEDGKIKEFYIRISDIVRAYVENGFHCPALERTTGELMRDLRQKGLFPSDKALQLKELLEECDLVKFAKFRPETGEALKAQVMAVQFVEKTRDALR